MSVTGLCRNVSDRDSTMEGAEEKEAESWSDLSRLYSNRPGRNLYFSEWI